MAWSILIDFGRQQGDRVFIHRLRNFGEDLWRACKEQGRASMSIADIDRATNQLRVTVSVRSYVRRTIRITETLLEAHCLAEQAQVSASNLETHHPPGRTATP